MNMKNTSACHTCIQGNYQYKDVVMVYYYKFSNCWNVGKKLEINNSLLIIVNEFVEQCVEMWEVVWC